MHIDVDAPFEHRDLDYHVSCVEVRTGFVPEHQQLLDELVRAVPWRQMEVLRYDRYVPERRLVGTIRKDSAPDPIRQAGMFLESRYRAPLIGPAVLLYRNGEDFQGLHSDREMKWLDETLVALLVLGEPRPFVLRERIVPAGERERIPAGTADGDVVLVPGRGDLLVMGGRCQRDWLHGVPAATTTGPRVSVMWRWTSRRGEPDTMPSYFDGRQYGDAPRQRGYRRSR